MAWDKLSITRPHLVYIILGGFTSLFMLCSSIIKERMYIGEATVATLCGLIFGPHAAGLIDPIEWGNIDIVTIEFSRLVLVVQCFAVGVELPKFYMEKHWRSVTFLLIPVMLWGWLITGLFVWWLIPPLNWLESLVVAACVTATDPVLASSVVGKGKFAKRVPKHLRDLLSAESGCNDGMAFPFIYLSLYLILDHREAREVSFHWIVFTILYECVFGAIYGFMVGYIARHGIKYAERHELIDRESFLVFYFVLALFCAGSGSILGVDDLLVGFAAGVGFSNDGWFTNKTEESHVSNVIDLLINLAYFVYLGTIIPWEQFNNFEIGLGAWRLVVLAIMVILFRRIPIMMALKPLIPDIKTWREALFAGHFGPIGVGAIFVAILARAELEHEDPVPLADISSINPNNPHFHLIRLVWPIVTFLVVSSIIVHGSSVAVFTLGKHINTLTITMSYTQANEDGPSWMNRLPRITSVSRSQARNMSDTEDDMKMPEFPPGTLPPTGLPGTFLRRQKEEDKDTGRRERSSSANGRRRRKRWDDGIGPGGPISQSAIFPQRRSQSEQAIASPHDEMSPEPSDTTRLSPSDALTTCRSARKSEKERSSDETASPYEPSPTSGQRDQELEYYDEGDHVIVEDREGNVLAVEPPATGEGENPVEALKEKLEAEAGPSGWSYDALKKKIQNWREEEMAKRKEKEKSTRRSEPARAYQFGTTIIVENEDGEVLKKYELPSGKPENDFVSQGLKYMGIKAGDKSAVAGSAAGGEGSASRPAKPTKRPTWASAVVGGGDASKKKNAVEEQEEDDRHIRFTIGGVGQRMNKEDFIREMQKLDKSTRKEVVDQSNASSAVKNLAKADLTPKQPQQPQQQQPQQPQPAQRRGSPAGSVKSSHSKDSLRSTRQGRPEKLEVMSGGSNPERSESPSRSRSRSPSLLTAEGASAAPSRDVPETAAERRRRLAVLQSVGDDGEGEHGETPAERRRREAALGMSSGAAEDEDSEDDDTPRIPPPRRGIRFAEPTRRET
ncbi:alkali metal cation/H+ antiporter Nha1 C terminus-domain-containing protein [Neurospora tetraspora]|uniref:Alkali metal cation/H+ antiporter Nha1 C terminus-domain-containing protein n=1 Tax=Neurospora tetraspora TaxID=94610 RepID=A0AAE0JCM8_9PEZI|nr:alkali metal cation/H+ antiporter Nha1 C terminus-domain-containing protein [Neurospora tetraspora]